MLVNLKTVLGMMTPGRAFCGPRNAQINISNICNAHCLMCSSFSPLLKDSRGPVSKPSFMDFGIFQELVRDLKKLGDIEDTFGRQRRAAFASQDRRDGRVYRLSGDGRRPYNKRYRF